MIWGRMGDECGGREKREERKMLSRIHKCMTLCNIIHVQLTWDGDEGGGGGGGGGGWGGEDRAE